MYRNPSIQLKYEIVERSHFESAGMSTMQQTTSVAAAACEPPASSLAVERYPLLAAARVVSRFCLPDGELSDVTRLLDAFLDEFSVKWTLVQSYKQTSSLRLMRYIAARHPATEVGPFYRRWIFNAATELATSRGDLTALQWLAESYLPDAFMTAAVEAAATSGYVHILEWLFERQRDRCYWGGMELCGALENNHAEVVEWLRMHAIPRAECVRMVLRSAAEAGNLVAVQWLCGEYNADAEDAFVHAQRSCEWATARWLLANCEPPGDLIDWSAAAADGALAYLQFAHSCFPEAVAEWSSAQGEPVAVAAAANGRLDVLQWLHSELRVKLTERAMREAAQNGHLNVVQWLHANNCEHIDASTMDGAALCGHFEIVRWLHDNRNEECSGIVMYWAAGGGHLEIVQWLHPRLTEACTTSTMNLAARNNRKDVVQWLHEHRSEGCTPAAMDSAAEAGHLEMVQWLHTHRKEGCTTEAMDRAAAAGHFDVVKWLHVNRSEGCTTWAMDRAAASGQLEVVKWLHDNRREGCTTVAMNSAATDGHLDVVKWLDANRSEGCRVDTMARAAKNDHLEVVKFLHKNRGEVNAQFAMTSAIEFGRFEVAQYLREEGKATEHKALKCAHVAEKAASSALGGMQAFGEESERVLKKQRLCVAQIDQHLDALLDYVEATKLQLEDKQQELRRKKNRHLEGTATSSAGESAEDNIGSAFIGSQDASSSNAAGTSNASEITDAEATSTAAAASETTVCESGDAEAKQADVAVEEQDNETEYIVRDFIRRVRQLNVEKSVASELKAIHVLLSKYAKQIDKNLCTDITKVCRTNELDQKLVCRLVAEYLYQDGQIEAADAMCKLSRLDIDIEFELVRLKYVDTLQSSPDMMDAVNFANKELPFFHQTHAEGVVRDANNPHAFRAEVGILMSCVLYKGKLEESPYKKLFNENRWEDIHDAVIRACCRLRRVPYQSYLETWYAVLILACWCSLAVGNVVL
ncbi:hypothetical protein BBJ28_00001326 [Nothophytophthora sp. Chile5]|nr:hypothetical protein BBJ28_00001326 [Nothophytophthora sp. Chile5]